MPAADIVQYALQGGWLVYTSSSTGKETLLPLTQFNVSFRVNELPIARLVPTIGYNIRNPKQFTTLTGLTEQAACKVIIQVNNTKYTLLQGYLKTITISQAAGQTNRRVVALEVQHVLAILAGARSASVVYSANHSVPLQTLFLMHKTLSQFGTNGGTNKAGTDLYPMSAYIAAILDRFKKDVTVADYIPVQLLYICETLIEDWGLKQKLPTDIQSILIPYLPANLSQVLSQQVDVLKHVASSFSQSYATTNAWEGLVNAADEHFLAVLPFSTGAYIADNCTLNRLPNIVIKAGEYASIEERRTKSVEDVVDGVALTNPMLPGVGSVVATFPEPLNGITKDGAYYHFREFPAWMLTNLEKVVYSRPDANPVTPKSPGAASQRPPSQDMPAAVDDYYQQLATRVAKASYANMRMQGRQASLTLPFRTDIMPGSIIQIQKPPQKQAYFMSSDLVGHVDEVQFSADLMGATGSFGIQVGVSSMRSVEENASNNLTFIEHPIYAGRWVGMNLGGILLENEPAVFDKDIRSKVQAATGVVPFDARG